VQGICGRLEVHTVSDNLWDKFWPYIPSHSILRALHAQYVRSCFRVTSWAQVLHLKHEGSQRGSGGQKTTIDSGSGLSAYRFCVSD
jgi:hypothetical protein